MLLARDAADVVLLLVGVGLGGFMLGLGLAVGAFVVRTLRRYVRDLNGHS